MPSARKTKRPPRPRIGDLWAIPIDNRHWSYAWVLKDLLVAYFDTIRDDPEPDLDALVAVPIAFRVWTSLDSADKDGWIAIGRRLPPSDILEPPQFFNVDPISGRIRGTRGVFGDEVAISVDQALVLEEAAVWQPSHIVKRLREHFAGFPRRWLESSRLARLGLLPNSARSSIGHVRSTPPAEPEVREEPRVWLRPLVKDEYFPQALVRKGQNILSTLDERIGTERPIGKAVYRLTHEATRAFNDLAVEFESAGAELETSAREAIADDIDHILTRHGYKVDLEQAIEPRAW